MIRLGSPLRGLGELLRSAGWRGLLLATCAACAQSAGAQDDLDLFALSPEQLFDATVIAAARTSESVWDTPAAVYVITGEDIARSGATSIPEALRLAPGVQVARTNGSGWAISIRGFNGALSNKLLVLIDGREVYDPLFSGVYWDVQDAALEDVDRIEVVRGPGASLWGANAVNGVINIVTKTAEETQGALVSAAAGDQERGLLTARYGGALGGDAHWRAYARYTDRAGYETPAGLDANDEWTAWRGGFRMDLTPGAQSEITLQGDVYRSESGQLRLFPSLGPPTVTTLEREEIVADGANVMGRWVRTLDNDARLTGQLTVEQTTRDQFTLRDERTTFDLDYQIDLPSFGAHDVIVGARYRNTVVEFTSTPIIFTTHGSRRDQISSAFIQDQIALSPERWRLTIGSKFEHNDYSGSEIQPNARLQWTDGELQTAWAAVSRAVRTPTALEHEFTARLGVIPAGPPPLFAVPVTLDLLPNPAFESEELIAYEAGYRRQWTSSLEMDVAAFFNDYDKLGTASSAALQLVLTPPAHVVLPVLLTNDTTAEAAGVETALSWRATDDLNLSANYSFISIAMHGPAPGLAFDAEAGEGRTPRNQASLAARWDATDRLAVDSTLYYVDELPDLGIDAYARFDMRLGWRLTDGVEVELVGQDLLDESNQQFGAPSEPNAALIERSVFGRLTWRN